MSGRPMKFPYTIAAKITRFPFHHYFIKSETGWVFRYWAISILICAPLWYKFQQLSKWNIFKLFKIILMLIYIIIFL